MIHLGDGRTADEREIVIMLPERNAEGKEVAAVVFADGSVAHTNVLARTVAKRLGQVLPLPDERDI